MPTGATPVLSWCMQARQQCSALPPRLCRGSNEGHATCEQVCQAFWLASLWLQPIIEGRARAVGCRCATDRQRS